MATDMTSDDSTDTETDFESNTGTTIITQKHDPPLIEAARENNWDVFQIGDVLPISRDTTFRVEGRHVVPAKVSGIDSLVAYARTEVEYDYEWMNCRDRNRDMDEPDTSYVLHLVTVTETGRPDSKYLVPACELQEHVSYSDEPDEASFTVQADMNKVLGLGRGAREVVLSIPSTGSADISGPQAESLAAILEQHASNPAFWPLVNADSAEAVLQIATNLRNAAHVMQVRARRERVSPDDES